MAKIIRTLTPAEFPSFMPMRELDTSSQFDVYRSVGNAIDLEWRLNGSPALQASAVLVRLATDELVAFRYGIADPEAASYVIQA